MKSDGVNVASVIIKIILITSFISINVSAADQLLVSSEKAWFKPRLIENNDDICDELLADATKKFLSSLSDSDFYEISKSNNQRIDGIKSLKFLGRRNLTELQAYGKTFYLSSFRHPGCGGACESFQSLVSPIPFPVNEDYSALSKQAELAPSADSYDYLIAESEAKTPIYWFQEYMVLLITP